MKFGVFDHLDRNDLPLQAFYAERLKFVEAYDRHGFHAYHTAEHHATPLGLAASPSVFLAAVAQRAHKNCVSVPWSIRFPSTTRCAWWRRSACSTSSARDALSSVSGAASRR